MLFSGSLTSATRPAPSKLKLPVRPFPRYSRFCADFYLDRKKVLKHHPDKKASNTTAVTNSLYLAGVNQNTNDDAFFKCIQKAHEVLTNPEKRRQFDSVDPVFMEFEEDMPTATDFAKVLFVR
jgi:hypothetical protein